MTDIFGKDRLVISERGTVVHCTGERRGLYFSGEVVESRSEEERVGMYSNYWLSLYFEPLPEERLESRA